MEVGRASNGWTRILLNPGEASALAHLLDKAYKPGMVGFGDGSMDSFVPDLRSSLKNILPHLSYGEDLKEEARRIASYSGTWWDHLWGKTPWGRERIRKILEKGPVR
jgi:hypothetical protein